MFHRTLLLIAAIFFFSFIANAATVLYLKDGTTIDVVRYEVKGKLVRYLDPISRRWEEIPAQIVDWQRTPQATENKKPEESTVQLKKGQPINLGPSARERGYQVGRGIYVPNEEGLYAFSRSQVVPLSRSAAILKQNQARKILNAAIPVFSNQSEVKLPGEQSSVRFASGPQTFYLRIDGTEEVEVELLRLETRSGKRIVSRISQGALTGRASKQSTSLAVRKELVEETLLRIAVDLLPPGEYAFWLRPSEVELKKGQVLAESGVWDFGVD
jgi:hypothetical protein